MRHRFLCLAALACLLSAAPIAAQANDSIAFLVPGVGALPQHVESIREQRFAHVVQQQYDFSCGAAVITTLFREAYAAPVTELDVLRGMFRVADPAVVRDRGFSLLDIKNYVNGIGLAATGFHVDVERVRSLRFPGIVLLNVDGYQHFVILKGIAGGYAFLADPALGNRRVPVAEFAREWNGIVLVVLGRGYRERNPLREMDLPASSADLYGAVAPVVPPGLSAAATFQDVPPVNHL